MKVLCVGRHVVLADHVASLFREAGAETSVAVGLSDAASVVVSELPDAVLCDYDLLTTNSLQSWESDPTLATVPVVAVSLTRRPEEACAFDVNGISGFLYLPTLDCAAALRTLAGLARHGTEAQVDVQRATDVPAEVPRSTDVPTDARTYRWPGLADAPAPAAG